MFTTAAHRKPVDGVLSFVAQNMNFAFSFLSFGPRIHKDDATLTASTAWRMLVLTLGLWFRRVVVDDENKTVSIFNRILWLFTHQKVVHFGNIQAITYGYDDWSPFALTPGVREAMDVFVVGLRLADDSEIRLFTFFGEGGLVNEGPFPDWWYWPDFALNPTGTQQSESRVFVDLLCHIIGVKVIPPQSE
jgi:hypothetical protein